MKTNRLINLGLLFFTILFCTTSCSKSSTNPSNITISDKDIYFVVKYTGQWATGCTSCDTTYQVYSGMPIFDNRPSQDVNSNINYNFIYTGRYLNIILKSELAVKTYQNASSSTLMTNDDFGIDYTNFPYPYSNLIAVSGQLQITKIQGLILNASHCQSKF